MVGKRRQEVKTEKTELNDDGTGDSDNQFARYQFRTRNKTKEVDPVKDEAKTVRTRLGLETCLLVLSSRDFH